MGSAAMIPVVILRSAPDRSRMRSRFRFRVFTRVHQKSRMGRDSLIQRYRWSYSNDILRRRHLPHLGSGSGGVGNYSISDIRHASDESSRSWSFRKRCFHLILLLRSSATKERTYRCRRPVTSPGLRSRNLRSLLWPVQCSRVALRRLFH
jgi:hypothetical protein